MKKTAFKYVSTIFFAIFLIYMLFNAFIPSKINIIKGENVELDTILPVSISSNAHTEGEIEYDFSSYEAGKYDAVVSVAGIPVKKIKVNILPDTLLVPCGNVEGIVLDYDGMLVLGTGKIESTDGKTVSPVKGIIKTGDIIKSINGVKTESREQLVKLVENSGGEELEIEIKRNNEIFSVDVVPALSVSDKKYKLGCWIRSETQGLGTITYVNKSSGDFGALGHGVYDADAKKLLEIKDGIVTDAFISGIKKGEKGVPGEFSGMLNKSCILGSIEKNTVCGVYGKIENMSAFDYIEMPVASSSEIETGKAFILNDAVDGKVTEYEIEIENIGGISKDIDKSMMIKITDERLLESTGGIVQGMSGSPIIQNGKLVGAVTHVLVNDPTRGYGIFIENMLDAAG